MESLHDTKILKFNPDTMVALRKMYNLDKPGQMDEAIDLLDAWLKKQSHFVRTEFPRDYLERLIILLKGSVERAKGQLDKICTLRTLLPQFFEKCDAKHIYQIIKGLSYLAILPKLSENNARILFYKYVPGKYSPIINFHAYCYNVLMCEYLKAHDYSNGIVIVVDMRNLNIMDFVSQLNLMEMKQICTIYLEGYDTRIQNLIFLSTSKTVDVFLKLLKQMISEKVSNRIHVIKDTDEMCDYISKEKLPSDYGGEDKSLAELNDDLLEELGKEENIEYFRQMSRVQTIESLRISTKYNEDFSGVAGTFRALSVD